MFNKKRRFPGPTPNLLKQNPWQVEPTFSGDFDIQLDLKTKVNV